MHKKLYTQSVDFEVTEGILIATYHPKTKVSLKVAKEIVADRLTIIGDKPMPTLILNQGIIKMTKEAREYLASEEGIKGVKCAAIIVNSNFIAFTVNFFLKVNKAKLKVKTFVKYQDGIKWLSKFID